MKPVRGYGDVEAAIDAIDKSSVKCVVLINCGAMEDIYGARAPSAPPTSPDPSKY